MEEERQRREDEARRVQKESIHDAKPGTLLVNATDVKYHRKRLWSVCVCVYDKIKVQLC